MSFSVLPLLATVASSSSSLDLSVSQWTSFSISAAVVGVILSEILVHCVKRRRPRPGAEVVRFPAPRRTIRHHTAHAA